jgi:hypothetical protein
MLPQVKLVKVLDGLLQNKVSFLGVEKDRNKLPWPSNDHCNLFLIGKHV